MGGGVTGPSKRFEETWKKTESGPANLTSHQQKTVAILMGGDRKEFLRREKDQRERGRNRVDVLGKRKGENAEKVEYLNAEGQSAALREKK